MCVKLVTYKNEYRISSFNIMYMYNKLQSIKLSYVRNLLQILYRAPHRYSKCVSPFYVQFSLKMCQFQTSCLAPQTKSLTVSLCAAVWHLAATCFVPTKCHNIGIVYSPINSVSDHKKF